MIFPGFVDHLGWVLIHSLWQFALILLVGGMLIVLMRRSTSTARYGVWVFALSMTVAAPMVTWCSLPVTQPVDTVAMPIAEEAIAVSITDDNRLAIAEAPPGPPPVDEAVSILPINSHSSTADVARSPTWWETARLLLHPWLTSIVTAWCGGVVLCSLRPLLGWHALWRLRTMGVTPAPQETCDLLRRVSARLGIRLSVGILHSTLAQVPIVVGYLRPVILLPASLIMNLPPSQLEAILAHELSHIRRHDFVVNLLQTLVETLFFYHPAVWWLSRQIRIEREHCCDDLVVAALDNRVEYGRALLAIEDLRGQQTVLALGASDGSLLTRIRRIVTLRVDRTESPSWTTMGLVLCLLGTMGVMSVFAWQDLQPIAADDERPQATFIATLADGVTMELLGVCPPGAMNAAECWRPDGRPMDDLEQWPKPLSPAPENATHEFLVRLTGRHEGQQIGCDMPGLRFYKSLPENGVVERISIRAADPSTLLRVGITVPEWGPWQSLSADSGEVVATPNLPRDYEHVYRTIVPHHIQKFEGQTGLVWSDMPKNYLAIMNVVAVDRQGKKHERYGASAWGDAPLHMDVFRLAPDSIDRFEYRLRPFRHTVTFNNISLVAGTETDVRISVVSPPKPAIAEWNEGKSLELVGITKNTALAKEGWLPSGLPIGDVGYWRSTIVLHNKNTSSAYVENGPHPEPDAEAIDFLFRFRGLKAQPSFTFELPADGSSYHHWPVADPYDLRVSGRRRGPPPDGATWSSRDGVVRVGLTDDPWGRWVKISPEGRVLNPVQPDELYAATYNLVEVLGAKKNERISTGVAILMRQPTGQRDPDNPEHQYAWEYRAVDNEGQTHWALQWEGRNDEAQYGLAQPLPARRTLSHYEYRLRPFRHWVTFKNVSLEPGPQTDVQWTTSSSVFTAEKPGVTNTVRGVVQRVDPKLKMAWINLGTADGVKPRQRFRVHRALPANDAATQRTELGMLEVVRVLNEHLAEARIVEDQNGGPTLGAEVERRPTVSLKITTADGSPATFNHVVTAQVGFPTTPLKGWIGWRDREGLVPLETLPFGTHWIVAAPEFEQRSIFPLTFPTDVDQIERHLQSSEPWTRYDLEFKPHFEPGEKHGGVIVVEIKNKLDKPLTLSEADFHLEAGQRHMVRGMSPQWADRKFQPVEIVAGKTGEIRLNWTDWVRKGFWASRDGETISEPTLPADEPGRIYVRVSLGNCGALPIAVTAPALILAE